MSPGTALSLASLTVAVAVVVDAPSATIDGSESDTVTAVAGPGVCVSVACALTPGADWSLAVIVECPARVVLVIVAL